MDYGPYEGMSLLKPKKEVIKFFSDFVNNPAPEGMEQLADIVARTGEFVDSIKDECSDGFFGVPESVFRIKKLLF
jgi:broad specificity phosphatase PhoE